MLIVQVSLICCGVFPFVWVICLRGVGFLVVRCCGVIKLRLEHVYIHCTTTIHPGELHMLVVRQVVLSTYRVKQCATPTLFWTLGLARRRSEASTTCR